MRLLRLVNKYLPFSDLMVETSDQVQGLADWSMNFSKWHLWQYMSPGDWGTELGGSKA